MDEFLDKLRTDVLKHCVKNNISVRKFLLGLGENGVVTWHTLFRQGYAKNGQIGLLLKLIKYFNYDK